MIETFLSIRFICKKVKYVQYTTRITATLRLLWGIFCGKNPVFRYWRYLYCRKGTLESLYKDAPGLTVRCITEKPKDMDPSMTSVWKIFNVLWHTQPTHFITVRGSLIPLFYYLYTLHIFRAFSSEIPWRGVVGKTQKSHCSCLQMRFPTPGEIGALFPAPQNTDELVEIIRNIFVCYCVRGVLAELRFFSRGASLVESNGLVGNLGQRRVP